MPRPEAVSQLRGLARARLSRVIWRLTAYWCMNHAREHNAKVMAADDCGRDPVVVEQAP